MEYQVFIGAMFRKYGFRQFDSSVVGYIFLYHVGEVPSNDSISNSLDFFI